ncbi:hypothetical protein D6D04_07768 [Aureobasidium pullulans]|nr:hypothetical protein D6D04_07768 [Aureobasidium pullulans]
MPDKHTVAQIYLAQVNNIISVGEALVQTDHVSESIIIYLRKALDSVYDALQDNAIELGAPSTASDVAKIVTTIRKKQKTVSGAKATKNDGDTEDEESEVEEKSIETTKRRFRGDTKCLLEKATVWPQATVARVIESYVDEISARSGSLFEAYKKATSVKGHSYGNEGTRDSYRLFVIEKAIPVVYDLSVCGTLSRACCRNAQCFRHRSGLEGYIDLKNIVHFYSPDGPRRGREIARRDRF